MQEARRLSLAAQGFGLHDRNAASSWSALAKTIDRLHLLQIDSVNVLVRSHYLPLFSRLGNYDRSVLDNRTLAPKNRHVFECWAHEASLVPLPLHPIMRWRMQRALKGDATYGAMNRFAAENKKFLGDTMKFIVSHGPVTAADVPGGGKSAGGWWSWSKGKLALETLFSQGLVTTAHRTNFARAYDISERVIPPEIFNLPTPSEAETFRTLIEKSAQALGVATETDLRDYFRLPVAEAKQAIRDCVSEGTVQQVNVESWEKPAYVLSGLSLPRKTSDVATLLSPFDPMVWNRDRAQRLFNFHYRIELYTPQHKRKFGYYVLPFLSGDRMIGRVCLKADRATQTLNVNTSHIEDGGDATHTASLLATELQRLAAWLCLENIIVKNSGSLARSLKRHF